MNAALRAPGAPVWKIGRDRRLTLDRPRLMGILNVTPDSFSDGGQFLDPARGAAQAQRMIAEGAAIIDIGGESTRPSAQRVEPDEQIRRVLPVIERVRAAHPDTAISIDTTRSEVARAAIEGGATIINDVSAGLEDRAMLDLAAERETGIVLMHRVHPPEADHYSHEYAQAPIESGDIVEHVASFLRERARAAVARGVKPEAVAIDPGLGFGKTVEQNAELMARMDELHALGFAVLGAASRKSFLGRMAGVEVPAQRDIASIAAAVMMAERGVRLFRVHEVALHRQALGVAASIGCFRAIG